MSGKVWMARGHHRVYVTYGTNSDFAVKEASWGWPTAYLLVEYLDK